MEKDMMRPNSALKGRNVMRRRKTGAIAAVFALALAAGLPGAAAGASGTVETVTYSPQRFDFTVSPEGLFSGNNNITFRISRTDGAENCRKIGELVVAHDPNPIYGVQHPGDYLVGNKELNPPLCTFQNVEVRGSPFLVEDINSVCFDTPMRTVGNIQVPAGTPSFVAGRSSELRKELLMAFHLGPNQPFRTGVPRKKVYLQANVQCVERPATGAVGPNWGTGETRQAGGSTGTATGTVPAPTTGSAFGGRQFTPVDPRTPPRVPSSGGSTQPEVVPRNPGTVPRIPVGSSSGLPEFTPRDPRSQPGSAGRTEQPAPSCNMAGNWKRHESVYWNFNEIGQGKYEVDIENVGNNTGPPPVPEFGTSQCIRPTAILSGNTLRFFNCNKTSASFFEGTVDSSCNQVSGVMYNTNGQSGPVTLSRVKDMRLRVPNPNP
jgi:hypothetical protein